MNWQRFTDTNFPSELRSVILYRRKTSIAPRGRKEDLMCLVGSALTRGWFNRQVYLGVAAASREAWETLGFLFEDYDSEDPDSAWTHWSYIDLPEEAEL